MKRAIQFLNYLIKLNYFNNSWSIYCSFYNMWLCRIGHQFAGSWVVYDGHDMRILMQFVSVLYNPSHFPTHDVLVLFQVYSKLVKMWNIANRKVMSFSYRMSIVIIFSDKPKCVETVKTLCICKNSFECKLGLYGRQYIVKGQPTNFWVLLWQAQVFRILYTTNRSKRFWDH